MKTLIFAATRKQKAYFSQLMDKLDGEAQLIWYKRLWKLTTKGFSVSEKHRQHQAIEQFLDQKILETQQVLEFKKPQSLPNWLQKFYIHTLRTIRRLEGRLLFRIYYHCIQEHQPQLIIIWNGLKFRQRLFLLAANELQVSHTLFLENGLLPNTTTADFKGINYTNSIPRHPQFFHNYAQTKKNLELPEHSPCHSPSTDTTEETIETRIKALPKKYIFIPFQVNSDSQITLFSPWIKHMSELFHIIIQCKEKIQDSEIEFVFKRHPKCSETYQHYLNNLPSRCHFVDDLTSDVLIENAEAVITINSTIGLESLTHSKKVISLGQAFYNIPGLTLQASSTSSLIGKIDQLADWQMDETLRCAFLHYLYYQYAIPQAWQEPNETHWKSIRRLIRQHFWLSHQQPITRKVLEATS